MRLRRIRKKVDKSIDKYGTTNPRSIEMGKIIDQIAKEQLEESSRKKILNIYDRSWEALKFMTIQLERFPTVAEWNQFATREGAYSSISLEYISGMNWNRMRTKIKREINEMIRKKQKREDSK